MAIIQTCASMRSGTVRDGRTDMLDDLKHFRAEPDDFDLDLSARDFAVIIACAFALGVLFALN